MPKISSNFDEHYDYGVNLNNSLAKMFKDLTYSLKEDVRFIEKDIFYLDELLKPESTVKESVRELTKRSYGPIQSYNPITPRAELSSDRVLIDTVINFLVEQEFISRNEAVSFDKGMEGKFEVYGSNEVFLLPFNEEKRFIVKVGDDSREVDIMDYLSNSIDTLNTVSNFSHDGKNVLVTEFVEAKRLSSELNTYFSRKILTKAVTQLAQIQELGLKGEKEGNYVLDDVVRDNTDYFVNRVKSLLPKIVTNENDQVRKNVQTIIENYYVVNDLLVQASLEDTVMYSDHGPNNILVQGDKLIALDFGSSRKLLGVLDFISLTEFGKIDANSSFIDYCNRSDSDDLFVQYLLERKVEQTKNVKEKKEIRNFIDSNQGFLKFRADKYFSKDELDKAFEIKNLASLQRHLEYVGYSERDFGFAPDHRKRNERNRQTYHIRKAKDAASKLQHIDGVKEIHTALNNLSYENLRR